MGRGQLQVVALFRVGHAATGQKGAPHEGLHGALLLQHAEIDVLAQGPVQLQAEGLKDPGQFFPVPDEEAALPGPILRRELIEIQIESPAKQPGQPPGRVRAGGDDADLPGGEGVAVQQHPVGLRQGEGFFIRAALAQFRLGVGGK